MAAALLPALAWGKSVGAEDEGREPAQRHARLPGWLGQKHTSRGSTQRSSAHRAKKNVGHGASAPDAALQPRFERKVGTGDDKKYESRTACLAGPYTFGYLLYDHNAFMLPQILGNTGRIQ